MRILLDESLPRPLGRLLEGHDVSTVTGRQWTGLKNGELLRLAGEQFDAVLTADQNLELLGVLDELELLRDIHTAEEQLAAGEGVGHAEARRRVR